MGQQFKGEKKTSKSFGRKYLTSEKGRIPQDTKLPNSMKPLHNKNNHDESEKINHKI